nr:putative integron gene cassette protein [uncultured bacterium]
MNSSHNKQPKSVTKYARLFLALITFPIRQQLQPKAITSALAGTVLLVIVGWCALIFMGHGPRKREREREQELPMILPMYDHEEAGEIVLRIDDSRAPSVLDLFNNKLTWGLSDEELRKAKYGLLLLTLGDEYSVRERVGHKDGAVFLDITIIRDDARLVTFKVKTVKALCELFFESVAEDEIFN